LIRTIDIRGQSGYDLDQKISVLISYQDRIGNGKVALIVKDEANFGMSRMFQLMADSKMLGLDIGVFYDFHAADVWLKDDQPPADSSED